MKRTTNKDLEQVESIIVEEDLTNYTANITKPLHSEFDGKDWYFSRAQSSGPILQLMLNMLGMCIFLLMITAKKDHHSNQ